MLGFMTVTSNWCLTKWWGSKDENNLVELGHNEYLGPWVSSEQLPRSRQYVVRSDDFVRCYTRRVCWAE